MRHLPPLLLLTAVTLGCQSQGAPPPPPAPPTVTVAPPVRRDVADYRDYTGRIEAVETVDVRARVRGFLEKIDFKEGTEVKQGDLLYEIEKPPFEADVRRAEADVARAEAQLAQATSEAERATRLRGSQALSQEEYVQRITARDTARATLDQARAALETARLNLGYADVRAPISGRISRTLVTVGNLVGSNEATLLTTIVRLDPIYVYFDAPERDYLEYQRLLKEQESLPTAEESRAPVYVGLETETGRPHKGTINFRENRVDPGTATIQLRGELPNADRVLVPGLFARVRVPFGLPRPTLLVSESAIGADQRGRFVLVVGPDGTVERRGVNPGRSYDGLLAIPEGLKPDDLVIVNGIQRARPGGKVTPVRQGQEAAGGESPPPQGSGASPPTSGAVPPPTASPPGTTK